MNKKVTTPTPKIEKPAVLPKSPTDRPAVTNKPGTYTKENKPKKGWQKQLQEGGLVYVSPKVETSNLYEYKIWGCGK